MNTLEESTFYKKKALLSAFIPFIFIFLMWTTKAIETILNIDLFFLGINPLNANGLGGIIFSPFIHADLKHLFNNSVALFILSLALFFFYSEVALKAFLSTWIFTGIFVWIFGRESWHIGASGIIYGIASFLFFSGIIRKYFRLVALSLLVVFLYGSMVWGLFPGIYQNVSWESHMLGFFSGITLAIYYRKEGPQEPVYEWLQEDIPDSANDESISEEKDEPEQNHNESHI